MWGPRRTRVTATGSGSHILAGDIACQHGHWVPGVGITLRTDLLRPLSWDARPVLISQMVEGKKVPTHP